MKIRWAFLACVVCVLGLSLQPVTTLAAPKAELGWRVPDKTYLHWERTKSEELTPDEELPADTKNGDFGLKYVHAMGYEIGETGVFDRKHAPLVDSERILQMVFLTPAKRVRVGTDWKYTHQFINGYHQSPASVESEYEVTAIDNEHVTVKSTHKQVSDDEDTYAWMRFELTATTTFDVKTGWMRTSDIRFRGNRRGRRSKTVDGKTEYEDTLTPYHRHWTWELKTHMDTNDDKKINRLVVGAIERGVAKLKTMRDKKTKLWSHYSHKRGATALSLLALLMCDVPVDDPVILDGFAVLKDTPLQNTYDVAVSLMAYEARYITDDERKSFRKHEDARAFKRGERKLSADDKAEVQRLVQWIMDNQNDTNPFWDYSKPPATDEPPKSERYDNSINQYAILGLSSASRCGIKIDLQLIRTIGEEMVKLQAEKGPEIKPVEGLERSKRGRDGKYEKPDRVTRARKKVEARGWKYTGRSGWTDESDQSYGSMTCAGITTLLVTANIAENMTRKEIKEVFNNENNYRQWKENIDEGLEGAFAWMEHRFSVTRNPNKGTYWYYYYLYGLERVGMLAERHHFGVHHWYEEGASVLLTLQRDNGSWGNVPDTAFALLFLKRGTVPLQRRVTTGEK